MLVVKNPCANAGDVRDSRLMPRSRRSPGGGYSNPLHCSCLENFMEESGGLQSIESQRVRHNWSDLAHMHKVHTQTPWNRLESPEIDPYEYSQLIFNKGPQQHNGKKFFEQMVLEKPSKHLQKKESKYRLYTCIIQVFNSKYIIVLNVKCKTTVLLEHNIGENLYITGFGDATPKAQPI